MDVLAEQEVGWGWHVWLGASGCTFAALLRHYGVPGTSPHPHVYPCLHVGTLLRPPCPRGLAPGRGLRDPTSPRLVSLMDGEGQGMVGGEMLFPLTSLPNRPGNGSRRAEEVPQEGWRWWCPTMG